MNRGLNLKSNDPKKLKESSSEDAQTHIWAKNYNILHNINISLPFQGYAGPDPSYGTVSFNTIYDITCQCGERLDIRYSLAMKECCRNLLKPRER